MPSRRENQPTEAQVPDLHGVYEKLGEITATLRDVSHTGRDNAQKITAIGELVIKQGAIQDHVAKQAEMIEKHDKRIGTLEIDLHHRQGAIGLASWFARHWPFTVILSAAGLLVAWANGSLGG